MSNQRNYLAVAAAAVPAGLALVLAAGLLVQSVAAVITVQIGGANRLGSLARQRDRYRCYWDCGLVGCQISRDDDECAYDCEKVCRIRYDLAGRSSAGQQPAADSSAELHPKSAPKSAGPPTGAGEQQHQHQGPAIGGQEAELVRAGTSVRLHLPRNASARNFAIWERCADDDSPAGPGQQRLIEKPFSS